MLLHLSPGEGQKTRLLECGSASSSNSLEYPLPKMYFFVFIWYQQKNLEWFHRELFLSKSDNKSTVTVELF